MQAQFCIGQATEHLTLNPFHSSIAILTTQHQVRVAYLAITSICIVCTVFILYWSCWIQSEQDTKRRTCTQTLSLVILITETVLCSRSDHLFYREISPIVDFLVYVYTGRDTLEITSQYNTFALVVTYTCIEFGILVTTIQ